MRPMVPKKKLVLSNVAGYRSRVRNRCQQTRHTIPSPKRASQSCIHAVSLRLLVFRKTL